MVASNNPVNSTDFHALVPVKRPPPLLQGGRDVDSGESRFCPNPHSAKHCCTAAFTRRLTVHLLQQPPRIEGSPRLDPRSAHFEPSTCLKT
eukprot:GHVN01088223.1.p1 GENE.GHVN01088223.1~~GHVN01088223.1.p1  ORF type:complete len:106 (+),score=9.82 GHVN01088223.1:47-319(+)